MCVHCKANNEHHRSLCLKKFPVKINAESVHVTEEIDLTENECVLEDENVLISPSESVLMHTAIAEVLNSQRNVSQKVILLLDCGSQRTYIIERLATEINLKSEEETEIKVATFGSTNPRVIKTPSTKLDIKLKDGRVLYITANIVPNITGTIYRNPLLLNSLVNINYLIKS